MFLQLVELASQRVPYFDNPPECDEGAHDLDVQRDSGLEAGVNCLIGH